jgi:phosphoglycerol transferase
MLGLSALTATWGLRRLGVSRVGAGVAGVLFALCPFALYRNIGHFNLVTYLIPFPATAAVLLASSHRDRPWRLREMAVPAAGCVLVGFNYIYYAFFGACIVAIGALVGAARIRSVRPLAIGALPFAALVLATTLNLVPNLIVWREHGQAGGVKHLPVESEIYGLKIRHLVSPSYGHWFPPFRAWLDREQKASFPLESENALARLGAVATAGFLGLIAALVLSIGNGRAEGSHHVPALAALTVAFVLLATIGGFGALFSLLVSPAIRAYNRVAPFIAFFSLAAIAIWIDRLTRTRPEKLRAALWVVILVVGMADQLPAVRDKAPDVPGIAQEVREIAAFVGRLETELPDRAMVFQLPIRPYPADSGVHRLGAYDQFKPYLTSRRLRWSYPSMTRDQLVWERALQAVAEADLPRYLAREGFSAILISRAGYPDEGREIEGLLRSGPDGATGIAADDRYIALDLRHLRPALPQ